MTTETSTATRPLPDLRPALLHAVHRAEALVDLAAAADLDAATPCEDYDLRTLLGHLLTVVDRVRIVTGGGHFAEVPQVTEVADEEIVTAWRAAVAALESALPSVDLTRLVTAPFGEVPAAVAVGSYVGEVAVHTWDVAATLDRRDLLDQDLAASVLPSALDRLPAAGRDQIPFGDVVSVADDAAPYDRLVGWFGRRPGWPV